MNTNLTFDSLPDSVNRLTNEVRELKSLMLKKAEAHSTEQTEQLLTTQEAANLLHLKVPTIYSKHSKGELPGVCKRGKRLYFSKQSLIEWLKQGRKKTDVEIQAEADTYLSNKRKGLK